MARGIIRRTRAHMNWKGWLLLVVCSPYWVGLFLWYLPAAIMKGYRTGRARQRQADDVYQDWRKKNTDD